MPYGYSIVLYDDDGFTGASYTVDGPFFSDGDLTMPCISIHDDFNDKNASLMVYRTTSFGNAIGKWVGYTSTEEVEFTIHYGFSTEYSEETTETQQFTLTYEMTSGIEFMGASESETISSSY